MGVQDLRAVALAVLAVAPPTVAIFRHFGSGLRLTERFLLALALAPFALALPALPLALLVRMPIAQCFWQAEFFWTVLALWPRLKPALPAISEPLPERGQGFPAIAAVGTALGAALLIGAIPLAVPYVRMWSDAWFHSAAIVEIGVHGVPPQDPNFAGIPFYYFWFFHFTLALLRVISGASPFHMQVFLNIWSGVVLVLAVAQLTYRAFGRAAAAWAGVIAVLGLNPMGWMFWMGRGLLGHTAGTETLAAAIGSINGAEIALLFGFPHNHSSMLNRFWTGTALTPAIALGVATAWSVARGIERPSRIAWLRTLALALATLAFHPAYAALVLAGLSAVLLGLAFAGERRGAMIALMAALALAVFAAVPYVRACSVPGATTPARFGLYTPNLWSLLLAVGPWWIVALPAFRLAWARGLAGRFTVSAALVAAAMAVVVVLPELNSEKIFYFAWVSLVPLLAGGLIAWSERFRLPTIARLAVCALLVVPTSAVYTFSAARETRSPGVLMRHEEPGTRNRPLETAGEAEAYRFIREGLDDDAVFIEAPLPWVNQPVPVLAERRVFCGRLDVYLTNHFGGAAAPSPVLLGLLEEFEVRRGIQHALFESGELNAAQRLYLTQFDEPLYLILRHEEIPISVWEGFMRRPEWEEVFVNREIRIYRFVPGD